MAQPRKPQTSQVIHLPIMVKPVTSQDLYGSTKETTDITGNPFAYNGEARDITGLDYLRARYYDISAGTSLTEDSYQGELTDPLSQNGYSYVHNNPVNYTYPSGHFWKSIQKAWNGVKKAVGNAWNATKKFVGNVWNSTTSWVGQQWNNYQSRTSYHAASSGGYGGGYGGYGGTSSGGSSHAYTQRQHAQQRAQAEQRRQQAIRDEYTQSRGRLRVEKVRISSVTGGKHLPRP